MHDHRITAPLDTVVVNPSGVLGGAESWLLDALDHTDRLRTEAILLADGPLRTALEERGVPVTVRPVGRRPADLLGAARWLRRELRRRDPDVVVGNGVKAQAVVVPAAWATGTPSVWVKHDHSYDARLAPRLSRLSTRVVTTADMPFAAGRDDLVVLEPPRPGGDPLPRAEARRQLGALGVPVGERLLLVMLTRFVPYKGIDTAVRALARPGAEQWDLVAIGGDEPNRPGERARLEALAAEHGVAGRVHLCGHVPAAARLLPAADALGVFTRPDGPRTPGREGFGMTAMEAQVAGVAVVAIDDGSPVSRRIAPGHDGARAGLVVPPDDADAVARALGVLAVAEARRAMGGEGRRRAVDHPDAPTQAARFAAVLAEAAHRPGAGLPLAGAPAVSVVSPVLNERANIDRLVGPIVAQLGPDDEYLLVDGGSSDDTVELIERWTVREPRVRLVRHGGGTIAHSRNVGIAAARHPFVACTDAGCDPGPRWLAGFRAAAAETRAAENPAAGSRPAGPAERPIALYVGVYRVGIRAGRRFEKAMAAVAWPDPQELRRPTPFRRAYGAVFGRAFSARRVDGRSVAFTREAWGAAGGFPEHLRTAEDEAFGRAVLAAGARSTLTLDAEVTWRQRRSVAATFRQFRGYGRGGGASRSPLLVGRDLVRGLAYPAAGAAVGWGGWPGAVAAALGAAAYLSLPVARVVRRRQSPLLILLLPFALALKDLAKVVGTVESLLTGGRRGADRRPDGVASAGGAPTSASGATDDSDSQERRVVREAAAG